MLGGSNNTGVHSSTQIVRPGQPTVWGPPMTEEVQGHCSTTLQDGSVIVTGGERRGIASARVQVFNMTSKKWEERTAMIQERYFHSCAQIWLDPNPIAVNVGMFVPREITSKCVLSVVVAGGNAGYFSIS